MDKEYSVWLQTEGEPLVLAKDETKSLTNNSRLLAQFDTFEEAYAYSKNLDRRGVFQGNIVFPQTGHKDNNGYFFLTQLHPDDVIQAIKDNFEDINKDFIRNQLTDDVMRRIAEDIVDNLLNDLYWTSVESTLESALPGMMEKLREREL